MKLPGSKREGEDEAAPSEPVSAAGPGAAAGPAADRSTPSSADAPNMLPGRARRQYMVETALMRVVATAGVVGIGVVIAAIMAASNVQGWIIGLAVSIVSVVLSAILWSSRQL